MNLEQYIRIRYLYDYGDERLFYAILKEIHSEEPIDKKLTVVNESSESLDQPY